MQIERLTGRQIYYGVLSGAKRLINNQQLLNKINVFPVPDGDTGSNLVSLMKTIVQEIKLYNSSKQIMNQIAEAALEAAEMIADDCSLEKVVNQVHETIEQTEIYVNLDTLEYMVKGGRLSRPAGWLGKVVNLKPIISLDEMGAGTVAAKAFSKRGKRGLNR